LRRDIIEIPLVRLDMFGHLHVTYYDMAKTKMQDKTRHAREKSACPLSLYTEKKAPVP